MRTLLVVLAAGVVTGIVIREFLREDLNAFKPEYELEILNQDSVAVKSLSTGRMYKVKFDNVQEALLRDNL